MGITRSAAGAAADGEGLVARAEALRLLHLVLHDRQRFDESFATSSESGTLAALAQSDRGLCYAIVATCLRRHGEIEAEVMRHLSTRLPKSSGNTHNILRIATAQLLFMRVAPHAAVDTAVRIARLDHRARHFARLVNAVCRKIAAGVASGRLPADPFVNTPAWLAERWRAAYGVAEAAAIAACHSSEPPLDITVRSEPQMWAEHLGGRVFGGCTVRLDAHHPQISALPGYAEGQWWVQDAASALPARLLGDVRSRRVLDLCAAPGGKTAQLAAAGGEVTAIDRSAARLRRLEKNLARLNLSAATVLADGLEYSADRHFDAVLLDAPCSGTGTIRHRPDVPFLKTSAQIAELAGLQRRLLIRAAHLVKPGGHIVFSTCSLEPEEGEAHMSHLPDGTALVPIDAAEHGLDPQWIDARGCLRTRPSQGLDGFFAMRLERR